MAAQSHDTNLAAYSQHLDTGTVDITPHVFSQMYKELRKIAHGQLNRSWSMNTISTTVLVNEAYLKLFKKAPGKMEKDHFFCLAATAMRHIVINYAEQKSAMKRGGDFMRITFDEALAESDNQLVDLLAVNEAIEKMNKLDAPLAQLFELRFFAGMTEAEIASVTGCSERSVRRKWRKSRMLLGQLMLDKH